LVSLKEQYNMFRCYRSGWGRYTQADPLADELTLPFVGLNLYAYGNDDPIDIIDPEGLSGSKPGGPYHPPDGVHTKCEHGDTCQQIRNKIWVLRRMIDSHAGWDRTMPRPRGGNRHSQEIEQLWKQYARCQELEPEACKENKCDACKKVAAGVAAVGTGYIIYRCVRMIPSIFPPFWPSIPLNALAP
jgi:RHS repeat-associated protein